MVFQSARSNFCCDHIVHWNTFEITNMRSFLVDQTYFNDDIGQIMSLLRHQTSTLLVITTGFMIVRIVSFDIVFSVYPPFCYMLRIMYLHVVGNKRSRLYNRSRLCIDVGGRRRMQRTICTVWTHPLFS
jgi:hypothetical protein